MAIDKWQIWLTWREAKAMVAASYRCDEREAASKLHRAWHDAQVQTDGASIRPRFRRKDVERIRPDSAPTTPVVAVDELKPLSAASTPETLGMPPDAQSDAGRPAGETPSNPAAESEMMAALASEEVPKTSRAVPKPGIRSRSEQCAEQQCETWLDNWGKEWRADKEQKQAPANKADAFARAKNAVTSVGELSEAAFKRVWQAKAPQEWKTAGAKKKNPRP